MKNKFFSLLAAFILLSLPLLKAQPQLWSMTESGGSDNLGTAFKMNLDGSGYSVVHNFGLTYAGSYPVQGLCAATNGKIYGVTAGGGINEAGLIFEYDTLSDNYAVAYAFDSVDWMNPINVSGGNPGGELMQAPNGLLYGVATGGGSNGFGVIYSFDPVTHAYTKLYEFDDTHGSSASGRFVQIGNILYGTTVSGGANADGVLYSFDITNNTYTDLFDFSNAITGGKPNGSLLLAPDGKLYGLTNTGGYLGGGVMFSFDLTGNTYGELIDFNFNDPDYGALPYGGLIQASNGLLYGMTNVGASGTAGGVLFSYNISTSAYVNEHTFDFSAYSPSGSLVQANNGKLYGTTGTGGSNNSGVIFSFDPQTSTYTNETDLPFPISGYLPGNDLIQGAGGMLLGVTYGGAANSGALYSFETGSAHYATRLDFNSSQGTTPRGSLVLANDGKLYGLSATGGILNVGVIFSIDPLTGNYTDLYEFDNGYNGADPQGSLMQASNGYLYGSTQYGGDNFFPSGVVFSYDPVLHNYNSMYIYYCTTGQYPYGDFLQASNGSMYILISNGWGSCTAASGTIMGTDLALSGASNQLLFTGANGAYPYGKLIEPKPGKFYGLTSDGGNNQGGVLFTYQPWASADVVKHHFSTIDGKMPYGNLTMASDGKLYGLTSAGGAHGDGVIFSFDTLSNAYTDLYDFDTVNGASPYGSLFEASNGKLYGMTNLGGLNGKGVIFNYDPSTSTFTKMRDLASSDGANPRYSNFIEVGGPVSVPTITSGEKTFNVFPNPANDNCIITYKAESSNANFNIINMLGEIVFTGQLKDLSTTIECKSFEAGIYTIHIQDAGKTFSKRLAIEK